MKENLEEAKLRQSKYKEGNPVEFGVGDQVWLSTKNIRTARKSKKLDYKRIGPFKIVSRVNKNTYKLDLPPTASIHDVFHVSLLDKYKPPLPGQQGAEPHPTIIEDDAENEWEVERILDSRFQYRKLQYLVQWAGYSYVRTSWEPAANLQNAGEAVASYHRENPQRPGGYKGV